LGRKRKRVIILRLPPEARQNPDAFIRYLSKALIGDTILMRMQGDKIRIEIYGSEALAAMTAANLKRLLREFRVKRRGSRETRVSRAALTRAAGVAVPVDVLVEVLRVLGYRGDVEGDDLVTNAEPETIMDLAASLGHAIRETQMLDATRTAKKLVLAGMIAAGLDQLEVIERAMEVGVLDEDDEGKLFVRGDWREALKRLIGALRREHGISNG